MNITLPTNKIQLDQVNHFIQSILTYTKPQMVKNQIKFTCCNQIQKIVVYDSLYLQTIKNSHSLTLNNLILNTNDFTRQNFHYTPKTQSNIKPNKKLVYMDTEMVMTTQGHRIAQISVISQAGKVIINSYCKPKHKIIDYLTKYSGVTKQLIVKAPNYKIVKKQLLHKLDKHKYIICGHGLDNDLKLLKIKPNYIIDTATLFGPRKMKLQLLAEQILNRNIQQGTHNSLEDVYAVKDIIQAIQDASNQISTLQSNKVKQIYGFGLSFYDRILKNCVIRTQNISETENDFQRELIIIDNYQEYIELKNRLGCSQIVYFEKRSDGYQCFWK